MTGLPAARLGFAGEDRPGHELPLDEGHIPWPVIGACLVSSAGLVISLIALMLLLSFRDSATARIWQISQGIAAYQSTNSANIATLSGELNEIQDELREMMTAPKACWRLTAPSGGKPGHASPCSLFEAAAL